MTYKSKSKDVDNVAKVKVKKVATSCPFCKSEFINKVKDTEKGSLFKCSPCGNRFQSKV